MRESLLFLYLAAVTGCSPASPEEFYYEGAKTCKQLRIELADVKSPLDLEAKEHKLKKKFAHLVDVMILAKEYQLKHPREHMIEKPSEESFALQRELIRIYQIEGCAETMEKIERESLRKLDLYFQKHQKRKL